ncbi:MAG: DNA polymerase Y family protein, partial [Acidimicrobiales bacterium]
MPVRTAVLWWPDWPVVAAGAGPGQPVAVVHANRVVACSAAARVEGVRRHLRRREAQARCPGLALVAHDPDRDARAFEPVVAALAAICPRVEVTRPGLVAFPARGPSRYFGGDEALAAKVVVVAGGAGRGEVGRSDEATTAGGQVGIADGPFAAGLAARQARVVAPGATPAFLAPFPVATLDRPDLADLFVRLGVRTLGDLAALPAARVLARFGPDGALAHRVARGLDERPLATRRPPPDLVVSAELDPPAERAGAAAFATKALVDELAGRLSLLGLACTRIRIDVETEHGESLSRLWRHDRALAPPSIVERVRWQLDGWLAGSTATSQPTAGITLLRLVPDEVSPDRGRQGGFWGGATDADERAARALARVQGLLGPTAVVTAVIGGGRAPAEQIRFVPWGDARDQGS